MRASHIFLGALLAASVQPAIAQTYGSPTFNSPSIRGQLGFTAGGYPILPSWTAAPSNAAGVAGFNSSTGRWEFGIGSSVENYVRLGGDTMTGQLNVGASTANQIAIVPKAAGTSPQVAAQGTDTNLDLILVSKGTGVVRTGSGTGNILRASHFSNVPGGPFTWSGNSSETNSPIYSSVSLSGTSGTSDAGIYYLAISGDTIDASTAAGTLASGLEVAHNYGGAAMKGSRSSINVVSTLTAASGSTNGNSYVAGQFTAKSGVTDNGSSGHYTSALFGINATAGLTSSAAQYWGGVVGSEIDVYAATGSKYQDMMGQQIVWTNNGTQTPDRDNIGYSLNNQFAPSSTAGFQYGFVFGKYGGNFPLRTAGTMIFGEGPANGSFTVAEGVDWHLGTASAHWFQFGSVASLTGAGALNVASYSVGGTAGVSCAAGTVSTATMVVTNGIVTHC